MLLDIPILNRELMGKTFIEKIAYFDEIDSTNNYARNKELGNNVLVIAECQTSGKGRFKRKWESNKSDNLTFTLRKEFDIEVRRIQSVNFFFTYFLLAGIESFLTGFNSQGKLPGLEIKWPNDILAGGKKIGGILIEHDKNNNFLVGIGLNVNQVSFSDKINSKTASLRKVSGMTTDRTALLIHILQIYNKNISLLLEKRYRQIFDLWINSCKMIGKSVNIISPDNLETEGKVVSIQEDGGILVNIDNNERVFYSSDISIKPE